VSEFFEPPPPQPEPERPRHRTPPWVSAPSGTLPGVVALELVLARTDQVAVCVTRVNAYPAGFELDLVTMANGERHDLDPLLFERPHRRLAAAAAAAGGIPPEKLRFGVEFADGTKATNIAGRWHGSGQEPPSGPVMTPGGGGGGGAVWRQAMWVWPLPPAGPMALVCEWPAAAIALTRHEIDAQLVLDAASRAQVIFADDELLDAPNARASTIVSARKDEPA
jgi:hypothetical protein